MTHDKIASHLAATIDRYLRKAFLENGLVYMDHPWTILDIQTESATQLDVWLENNGGFVQAALDLSGTPASDASEYAGVLLQVYGNGERYNLHLRTRDVRLPWQSYRASFEAPPRWQTLRLPFAQFSAHRIDAALDLRRLERAGIVAIGREFTSDLCIASLALYR